MVDYVQVRLIHGVLMTLAWVFCHFLGSMFGKRLKDEQGIHLFGLKPRERYLKVFFYTHAVLQGFGVLIGTAGFILSMLTFQIPYELIRFKHGYLGIATMALVYFQGLLGVIRPKPVAKLAAGNSKSPAFWLRKTWEHAHGIIGKTTLVLGLVNCFTGVALMEPLLSEENDIIFWSAIPIGWILLVIIADGIFDKCDDGGYEKQNAASHINTSSSSIPLSQLHT